ncbi:nicotinate-nucleotide adenylyltransferase [Hyunsoonleella sp. SJ7]|uniref:Nicotinate-nucleotide adenylyltransferase n=1 Tax=Hyunsoonleella aquatilis TaxID=2762758 RepID=A0A923KMD4_9FLAO|nr:nicotinate-nucleotide adenylyltransferase [Hyunsoonleella aquatilis]MBC3759668.1 nicotinate-nucleotide adenylyltransferase [Hyunsoonleella aquatilis]
MKTYIFCLFGFCFATFVNSQTVELPETVISINSHYLNSLDSENSCHYVKKLEQALLKYDHSKISSLYDSKSDIYRVTFKIPNGHIVASFNKDGKIVKTFEKYNNVRLPQTVLQAIAEKYPNYSIVEDVYIVKYHRDEDNLKQEYRIKVKTEDEIFTVKTNNLGVFI